MSNPIHIFHGADTYRSKKQLDRWRQVFQNKHQGGTVQIIDQAESPLLLSEIIGTNSLFANISLWIIVNPFTMGSQIGILDTDDFLNVLDKGTPDEHHVVLWQKGSLDKRLAVTKKILKFNQDARIKLYEFQPLEDTQALKFLAAEFKERDFKLNRNAGELMLSYCSDAARRLNSWQAYGAIEQLSAYAQSRDTITVRDVEAVVPISRTEDVFLPLLRDFAARDQAGFYKNLDILLKNTDSEHELLGLLSALFEQVKNMILVLELSQDRNNPDQIDKKLDFKPGRSRYILRDAKKFDPDDLEELAQEILDLEKEIKSSNVPAAVKLAGLART